MPGEPTKLQGLMEMGVLFMAYYVSLLSGNANYKLNNALREKFRFLSLPKENLQAELSHSLVLKIKCAHFIKLVIP